MKIWPIFIPIIGFIYFIIMCFKDKTEYPYWSDKNDAYWQFGGPLTDSLTFLYIFYILIVQLPNIVFLGFLIIA